MTVPLLTTKLYIPSPHPDLVPRPRLTSLLDEGLRQGHRLTLVSAPAAGGRPKVSTRYSDRLEQAGLSGEHHQPHLSVACHHMHQRAKSRSIAAAARRPIAARTRLFVDGNAPTCKRPLPRRLTPFQDSAI